MPANVKQEVVKQYWDSAVQAALDEFEPLVAAWESLMDVGIPSSEWPYKELHFWSDRVGLLLLVFLQTDLHATQALWNANEAASRRWREKADSYQGVIAENLAELGAAFRQLKVEKPEQFGNSGFTQEMFEFIGSGDLYH